MKNKEKKIRNLRIHTYAFTQSMLTRLGLNLETEFITHSTCRNVVVAQEKMCLTDEMISYLYTHSLTSAGKS